MAFVFYSPVIVAVFGARKYKNAATFADRISVRSSGGRQSGTLDHRFLERVEELVQEDPKDDECPRASRSTIVTASMFLLEGQAVVRGVMAKTEVADWQAVQYVVVPLLVLFGVLLSSVIL